MAGPRLLVAESCRVGHTYHSFRRSPRVGRSGRRGKALLSAQKGSRDADSRRVSASILAVTPASRRPRTQFLGAALPRAESRGCLPRRRLPKVGGGRRARPRLCGPSPSPAASCAPLPTEVLPGTHRNSHQRATPTSEEKPRGLFVVRRPIRGPSLLVRPVPCRGKVGF